MGLAVLHGVVYIAGGNRGTGRLRSVEKLLPGAKRCLNLLNYDSVNNRYTYLKVQCSKISTLPPGQVALEILTSKTQVVQ